MGGRGNEEVFRVNQFGQEAPIILWQCEMCFRYCDLHGRRLDPQPKYGAQNKLPEIPGILVCGPCKVCPPPAITTDYPRKARLRPSFADKRVVSPSAASGGRSSPDHLRGCPPERDLPHATGEPHAQHVARFNQSANAKDRDGLVFDELNKSFDFLHPENPGSWVTGWDFLHKHGVKAANSCAARIRDWPDLVERGIDVDSAMIPNRAGGSNEWWAYRLCRIEDSQRLAREQKRKEHQIELKGVGG